MRCAHVYVQTSRVVERAAVQHGFLRRRRTYRQRHVAYEGLPQPPARLSPFGQYSARSKSRGMRLWLASNTAGVHSGSAEALRRSMPSTAHKFPLYNNARTGYKTGARICLFNCREWPRGTRPWQASNAADAHGGSAAALRRSLHRQPSPLRTTTRAPAATPVRALLYPRRHMRPGRRAVSTGPWAGRGLSGRAAPASRARPISPGRTAQTSQWPAALSLSRPRA